MATYKVQSPDGRVVTLSGDEAPTEADLEEVFSQLPAVDNTPKGRMTQQKITDEQNSAEWKKKSGIEHLGSAAVNAMGELADIGKAAYHVVEGTTYAIDHPIKAARNVYNAIHKITPGGVMKVASNVGNEFLKSFGVDMNREGAGISTPQALANSFSMNTLLKKWEGKPLSAIGDATIAMGVMKRAANAVPGVTKAIEASGEVVGNATKSAKAVLADKQLVHGAFKRNGKNLREMFEAAAPITNQETLGVNVAQKIPGESPYQKLFKHADVIQGKDKMTGFSVKQLDDPNVAREISKTVASDMVKISKLENIRMNKALEPVMNTKVDTSDILSSVSQGLKDGGLATTSEEFIKELNKTKLLDIMKLLGRETRTPMAGTNIVKMEAGKVTVKELKNVLDTLDQNINWVDKNPLDDGMKIMRRSIRAELGKISPEYDTVASRIHDRLVELGPVEKKVLGADKNGQSRDFLEKMGLDIVSSPEKLDSFNKAMELVGGPRGQRAIGKMKSLDAWRAWNEFFDGNARLMDSSIRDVSRNTALPFLPDSIVNPVLKRGVKARLSGAPQAAARSTGAGIKSALKNSPLPASIYNNFNASQDQ